MPDAPAGIDPRGPRFAAAITTLLLVIATYLSFVGISTARGLTDSWIAFAPLTDQQLATAGNVWTVSVATLAERAADPGFIAVAVVAALFVWGVASPRTAPWGVVFRRLVRPRLAPPTELEDPRPPRFAQGVGLFVTAVGLVLHLVGVPWALPIAAAAALIAAFLNAAFGLCLGCQLYLLLQRAGVVGRTRVA